MKMKSSATMHAYVSYGTFRSRIGEDIHDNVICMDNREIRTRKLLLYAIHQNLQVVIVELSNLV